MNFKGFSIANGKVPRKIVDSKLRDESTKDTIEETDFIQSVSKTEIIGTIKKKEKKELVIPLITKNNWREEEKKAVVAKESTEVLGKKIDITDDLEKQAVKEILESTKDALENSDRNEVDQIPLLLQNRIPHGFEEDDNMDVSLRPEQSTLEEYEKIPIEEYGMAMLRGMGWNKNEGIGLRNKMHVEMKEPQLRPKGLGLGAERPQTNKDAVSQTSSKDKAEQLTIKIGGYAVIEKGSNRGLYGTIESFDEDNNRVILKLAIGSEMAAVSKFYITVVSEKEYKQKSKVINNEKYEEYKLKQDKKEVRDREEEQRRKYDEKSRDRKRERSRGRDSPVDKKSKRKHKSPEKEKSNRKVSREWMRPNLRVRFIDENYKKGKYYEKKFVIEDVCTTDMCILRSDRGEILDEIRASQLETVIPKGSSTTVCVLYGKFRGQIGEIVQKDKSRYIAMVQILPDRTPIIELDYDDICEYVGDISHL